MSAPRPSLLPNDLVFALLQRPVAFHPALAKVSGSVKAGILLSQAFYWQARTTDPEGWFFKTRQDWEEETALGRVEQETAREKLRRLGILEEKLHGLPAKLYFRINVQVLIDLLSRMLESHNQGCEKVTTNLVKTEPSVGSKSHQLLTESTAESTKNLNPSDLDRGRARKPPRPPASKFLPDSFEVTEDLRRWAGEHVPDLDIDVQTAMMRDHEYANAHTDWPKAWRNWMRRALTMEHRQDPTARAAAKQQAAMETWIQMTLAKEQEKHHGFH